jgi:hypothetical protein
MGPSKSVGFARLKLDNIRMGTNILMFEEQILDAALIENEVR